MKITNHRLEGAAFIPSPNVGNFIDPHYIIMHYTAGLTAKSAIQTLTSPAAKVSAHFVIDLDGTITQLVACNRAAWHAGPSKYQGVVGLNNHSIGIEIVNPGWVKKTAKGFEQGKIIYSAEQLKPFDLSLSAPNSRVGGGTFIWPGYTAAQIKALKELTKAITTAYKIVDVTGHENIDTRGWKTDPGPAFPMGEFKALIHNTVDRSDGGKKAKLGDVTAARLNVRGSASSVGKIIGTLTKGQDVTILEDRGDWLFVQYGVGLTGFVAAQYVKEIA